MKSLIIILSFIILSSACFFANAAKLNSEESTCNFFLIKAIKNEVVIEKIILKEDQTQVFKDDNILSYIMVFAPGSKSGELIQNSQKMMGVIAQYSHDVIKVSILNKDGTQKEMPDIDLSLAQNSVVRLNATGFNDYKKAFIIDKWDSVCEDYGPVMDMFAGKIPLNSGDYSFFTESLETKSKLILNGESPYTLVHDWITVDCDLPGGNKGRFVIDFGASSSVIDQNILTAETEIHQFQMVEYSANGEKVSNAQVGGATGMVDNIAGKAVLPKFSFGNIELQDFKITVMEQFPEAFQKYGIDGIIGMDILQKTNYIRFTETNQTEDNQFMIFSSEIKPGRKSDYTIPLKKAGGHLFLNGKLDEKEISFILDTGAGMSVIGQDCLEKNNIGYNKLTEESKPAMGLDGEAVKFETIVIENIVIEDISLQNLEFMLLETFVFEGMGIKDETALLGMNFLLQYSEVCFDVSNNQLLLWE